jgi:hypothetical protein
MTNLGQEFNQSRRRTIRAVQLFFAGAAAVAALALFNASPPSDSATGPLLNAPFATDDTNFVNDNGQTSGDIFQQNAQDQN